MRTQLAPSSFTLAEILHHGRPLIPPVFVEEPPIRIVVVVDAPHHESLAGGATDEMCPIVTHADRLERDGHLRAETAGEEKREKKSGRFHGAQQEQKSQTGHLDASPVERYSSGSQTLISDWPRLDQA